jgi:hypothetical protein
MFVTKIKRRVYGYEFKYETLFLIRNLNILENLFKYQTKQQIDLFLIYSNLNTIVYKIFKPLFSM